jgi:hypothetical protein
LLYYRANEDHTRLPTVAAVLLAEGKCSEATEAVYKALAAAPKSADRGGSRAEIDWPHAI